VSPVVTQCEVTNLSWEVPNNAEIRSHDQLIKLDVKLRAKILNDCDIEDIKLQKLNDNFLCFKLFN